MSKNPRNHLVIALDVPSAKQAFELVEQTQDYCAMYKVGLQLFIAEGPKLIRELAQKGVHIFLDLKLHDIPNTVASAVKEVALLPVHLLTLHALAGSAVLEAAQSALQSVPSSPLQLLAVSVLTHHSDKELQEMGFHHTTQELATELLRPAHRLGLAGCIASPWETAYLKAQFGQQFQVINPGIRPLGISANEQTRIQTPSQALIAGADKIVVGRPITMAPNPHSAALAIYNEIAQTLPPV